MMKVGGVWIMRVAAAIPVIPYSFLFAFGNIWIRIKLENSLANLSRKGKKTQSAMMKVGGVWIMRVAAAIPLILCYLQP